MFWTSFSFSTKVANLEQKDSCAECFDANFEQQDSCARCFTQALRSEQYGPIWSKTTVAQSDLRPISSNSTVAHAAFYKFYLKQQIEFLGYYSPHKPIKVNWKLRALFPTGLRSNGPFQATWKVRTVFWTGFIFLTKVANLERNDSCAECFDANFEEQNSFARGFGQVLAF